MVKSELAELFKEYRYVGVVGDINTSKSSLILSGLLTLKENFPRLPIYILGAEPTLYTHLLENGLEILYSADDVLDLKLKNCVIYIDEFAEVFDTKMSSKQGERIKKFFNRGAHLNVFVIISSAEVNFWNKFICSLVRAHLVKKVEYNHLVNGTDLKRKIKNITENTSDYRLDIPKNTYYIITDDLTVSKKTFKYDPMLDSKIHLKNPFKVKAVQESLGGVKNE